MLSESNLNSYNISAKSSVTLIRTPHRTRRHNKMAMGTHPMYILSLPSHQHHNAMQHDARCAMCTDLYQFRELHTTNSLVRRKGKKKQQPNGWYHQKSALGRNDSKIRTRARYQLTHTIQIAYNAPGLQQDPEEPLCGVFARALDN